MAEAATLDFRVDPRARLCAAFGEEVDFCATDPFDEIEEHFVRCHRPHANTHAAKRLLERGRLPSTRGPADPDLPDTIDSS